VNATELKRAKKAVRSELRAIRDAMPAEERRRRSREIVVRFLELPEVRAATTVMAFWSFGSEVDTGDLIRSLHERTVRVALPRIAEGELTALAYAPGDRVTYAPFGAGEPVNGEELRPEVFDLILVPGVAFDRAGRRIGYGGGYYDRFLRLADASAFLVAVAFREQVLDGPLPAGRFDLPIDAIVTERETIRIPREHAPT